MSINELIHTNAYRSYEQGSRTEQKRVAKIVEGFITPLCKCDSCNTARAILEAIS